MTFVMAARTCYNELLGQICFGCGGVKEPMKSHCRPCFYALPKALRSRLYNRIGDGYELAYTEALTLLRDKNGLSPLEPEDGSTDIRPNNWPADSDGVP